MSDIRLKSVYDKNLRLGPMKMGFRVATKRPPSPEGVPNQLKVPFRGFRGSFWSKTLIIETLLGCQ